MSEFLACFEAIEPLFTPDQKAKVLAFAMALLNGAEDRAEALKKQHDFERAWEERQIASSGDHLAAARRAREP